MQYFLSDTYYNVFLHPDKCKLTVFVLFLDVGGSKEKANLRRAYEGSLTPQRHARFTIVSYPKGVINLLLKFALNFHYQPQPSPFLWVEK